MPALLSPADAIPFRAAPPIACGSIPAVAARTDDCAAGAAAKFRKVPAKHKDTARSNPLVRIVDVQGDYYALCPYASRVPYETWLLHRRHNHLFEQPRPGSNRRQLAALLGRVLRRLEKVAPAFHLVVYTSPNTRNKKGELSGYWKTLPDDYHWHIEILPIVEKRSKSYSIKEVYFNAELPEQAAANLRALDPNS